MKANPYFAVGDKDATRAEYEKFCGSIAQLLDEQSMIGDVAGQWVIFKDGWVYGMASYKTYADAYAFAQQIFRDEPDASYIIVEVDLEKHDISPLVVLASALSDVDQAQICAKEGESSEEDDAESETE